MDAFDADVLIYAIDDRHPLGTLIARLFDSSAEVGNDESVGMGSVLLIPELLSKPLRSDNQSEFVSLLFLLSRLTLRALDAQIANAAAELGAKYRLKPIDAAHLATAAHAGADRFITNNRKDFGRVAIDEIAITFPEQL